MGRGTMVLLGTNVLLIIALVALKDIWFGGSVGCDDEGSPQAASCDQKVNAITALFFVVLALLGATAIWVGSRLFGRGRSRSA